MPAFDPTDKALDSERVESISPSPTSNPPLLSAEGLRKSYSGINVLENISFDIRRGEVHTLMGENGAGKTTLMKILAGIERPDAGTIRLDGTDVVLSSPLVAIQLGIALIHQEPSNFPDLSIAENIFLGRRMPRGAIGQIDHSKMYSEASNLLHELGIDLNPKMKMGGLSIADQQMIELAAALSQKARVLLMDEPTASITPREVERLFEIVRRLRDSGAGIVFISHRLPEVFGISDRITVLRDGALAGTRQTAETNTDEIVRMMVGRPLSAMYEKSPVTPGEVLLKVNELSQRSHFTNISFDVRAGEIVGLAGLVGAGRTEVARAIFGLTRADSGSMELAGRSMTPKSPRDAIRAGLAYVPEDRQQHGLLLPMSISANTTISRLSSISRYGWLLPRRERTVATDWMARVKTRFRDIRQPARELSGGNQQKVVLSKWLLTEPRVLILDEPTRGIDVGAKAEVHHLMADLARQGKAVLMISSDLPEVLAMSDRVLVMREGQIAARFNRAEATQETIMAAATGSIAASNPAKRAIDARTSNSRGLQFITRFKELGIAAFVAITFIICTLLQPRFASLENLRSILLYIPLIVVVAMGEMMTIVSRNIDLSVGSVIGLAAIVVGNQYIQHPNMPLGVAMLLAVIVGCAAGLMNGILIAILRVPAIIATLGTLTAYRGLIFIYSGGHQVDNNDLPYSLIRLSQTSPIGVPWIVLFALVVAIATALWLRYANIGRFIFAIGSNPRAAELRGIPVRRVLLLIFALTGMLSGIAGLMFASRFGYVNPMSTGAQMELIVISAVVIGGVNVFGGSGTVLGVLLGCLMLGIVNVALPMLGVSAFWQLAIYGAAILLAAMANGIVGRYIEKELA